MFVDTRRHLFHVFCGLLGHLFRPLHIIFGPRNQGLHSGGSILFLVDTQIFDSLFDKRGLVACIKDTERSIQSYWSEIVGFYAQDTGADGMKGANHHLFRLVDAYQLLQALAHLLRRFIGKGDSQDVIGRNIFMLHKIGYAVRHDAGFAAARPSQN